MRLRRCGEANSWPCAEPHAHLELDVVARLGTRALAHENGDASRSIAKEAGQLGDAFIAGARSAVASHDLERIVDHVLRLDEMRRRLAGVRQGVEFCLRP